MLTRIEVNGFKNLLRFHAELGPFTCIAGPNGSGKSNLFDAIRFLALLADHPLMEAAARVRGTQDDAGDPRELFWRDQKNQIDRMSFAVEMIVPKSVSDDFGRTGKPTTTFLRYELELGYEPPSGLANLGRLVLLKEELTHIKLGDAFKHLRFPHSAKDFRRHVVTGRRAGSAFISTKTSEDGLTEIHVHQDGGSRGQPRPSPAQTAPRTIVSTTTTASDPTILAARREFQSWQTVSLEPSKMRASDRFSATPRIGSDGSHLPATLYRLATSTKNGSQAPDPAATYAKVAARLSEILGVRAVRVDRDDRRQMLTVEVQEHGGDFLPARALSEGTLRFLALCVLREDPEVHGLLCMEEPENGIHPLRMGSMVDLVRELAVDTRRAPGPENPMRQVIVNTHSPAVVQLQNPEDLLFADTTTIRGPGGRLTRTLRLRPLQGTWRTDDAEPGIGKASIIHYLTAPRGTQIELFEGDDTTVEP